MTSLILCHLCTTIKICPLTCTKIRLKIYQLKKLSNPKIAEDFRDLSKWRNFGKSGHTDRHHHHRRRRHYFKLSTAVVLIGWIMRWTRFWRVMLNLLNQELFKAPSTVSLKGRYSLVSFWVKFINEAVGIITFGALTEIFEKPSIGHK